MPKHVVLLSGGIDSTVACALAAFRDGPEEVTALLVAYGQRHINELTCARHFTEDWGIARYQAHVDPAPWKQLPLLTGKTRINRPVYAMQTGGISDAYLPGRNVAFLSLALMVAGVQNAECIWIGANADDAAGFPDCRPEFIWEWARMARHALDRPITLLAPLLYKTKREVVQLARDMAIDLSRTWSCYRPLPTLTGVKACGRCDACVLRADALGEEPVASPALT